MDHFDTNIQSDEFASDWEDLQELLKMPYQLESCSIETFIKSPYLNDKNILVFDEL